jgi:hypothetical protein
MPILKAVGKGTSRIPINRPVAGLELGGGGDVWPA